MAHRKAFGPQRTMSPAVRARNVAESMHKHGLDIDDPATWRRYGIVEESEQGQLVIQALCRIHDEVYGRVEPLLDRP